MARAGSLHVTVIAATLLRDAGRSDSEPADTYASVGCGSQNFTTSSVKNHRAKPAWNESHTFKFDERDEKESQHILIEIFAEKPKLDELLGLAKIPLQKVITAGDEISTHPLNRPHEEYTSHEQYSGHVKVALKWDSAQRASATAYPQTYTPAARYNANASPAKLHTLSGQTTRSQERLQSYKSAEELHHPEDFYVPGQDRRVHNRSSSCPSDRQNFFSSAPFPSQSSYKQPLKIDENCASQQHPSNVRTPTADPSSGPTSCHSRCHTSFEAPSNAFPQQEHGHGSSRHVQYAGPHVPYVPHEGMPLNGHAVQPAVVQESGPANSYLKLQDDGARTKLSKSKQAEMLKLAELSRLTQIAKVEATGLAKAGKQTSLPSNFHAHQQSQVSSRPNINNVLLTQLNPVPTKQRNDVSGVPQQVQASQGIQRNHTQPLEQLRQDPQWPDLQSKQLSVVPNMLDIVSVQPRKQQQDQKPEPLLIRSQRQADIIYEKAIQKPEKLEKKKKLNPFRRTLKILTKTSKIFGI